MVRAVPEHAPRVSFHPMPIEPLELPDPLEFPNPADEGFWPRYLESCRRMNRRPVAEQDPLREMSVARSAGLLSLHRAGRPIFRVGALIQSPPRGFIPTSQSRGQKWSDRR